MFMESDYILRGDGTLALKITGFEPESFELLDITKTTLIPGGTIDFSIAGRSDRASEIAPGVSIIQQLLGIDDIGGFPPFPYPDGLAPKTSPKTSEFY
jgi:hypothetical protein